MDPGPVLVTEWRGDVPQALHSGHAVLLDAAGSVIRSWGDPATPCHWRSAAKPLQAVPFAAAAPSLGLGQEALALACGSHEAEPDHVAVARAILDAAGAPEEALACGAHACDPRLAGPEPAGGWSPIQNNCSGKHAAMLAACARQDWPLAGYLEPEHPLQQRLLALVAEASGAPSVPVAVDGCGAPTFVLPVLALARAMQWLHHEHPAVLDAMAAHPRMVGGTDRFDTTLIAATRGRVLSKIGAAGVHVALDRASGAALAVKLTSGSGAARDVFTARVLRDRLGAREAELLERWLEPVLRNHVGRVVGRYA